MIVYNMARVWTGILDDHAFHADMLSVISCYLSWLAASQYSMCNLIKMQTVYDHFHHFWHKEYSDSLPYV